MCYYVLKEFDFYVLDTCMSKVEFGIHKDLNAKLLGGHVLRQS